MNFENLDELPTFDWTHLLETSDNDAEFAYELIGDFLAESTPLIEEIQVAFQVEGYPALEPLHALKGTSGAIGALRLHKVCIELEKQLKSGSTEWDHTYREFLNEFEHLCHELKQTLAA